MSFHRNNAEPSSIWRFQFPAVLQPRLCFILAAPCTGNRGNNPGTSLNRRLRRSGSHAIKRNLEGVILAGSHEFG
jgi:hypothetical protein